MFFRIVIVCLVLAGFYAAYEIFSLRNYYTDIARPKAVFTVRQTGNHSAPAIVEFLNYDCGHCKPTHLVLLDYAAQNPEAGYTVRPVPFANGYAENASEMAMAAGLQGKFWEMDRAIAEYAGVPDEKFFRETAGLYDIDFDRMVMDSEGEEVQAMVDDNAAVILRTGIKSVPAFMIGKTIYQLDRPLTLPDLIRMVQSERDR